jgi:hypothetical protein
VLAVGPWALINFEGLGDYPALLRAVEEVYATHSYSLATVAAALGAPVSAAPEIAVLAGVGMLGVAAWLAGRPDADRRVFAVVLGACIVASPIVWPNYAALLLVPVAVTWPRLAPAWFFGYAFWLAEAVAPSPTAFDAGAVPKGVTEQAWLASHTDPFLWYGAGFVAAVIGVTALVVAARAHIESSGAGSDVRCANWRIVQARSTIRPRTTTADSSILPRMEGESLSVTPAVRPPALGKSGLREALRRIRDPLLFGVLPAAWAIVTLLNAYDLVGMVGFDFRGTLWAPAHALLEGSAVYADPTRAAIELGNPAVYPPFVVTLVSPLALLPAASAALVWAALLAIGVMLSLWLVGVRDWRCYTVALASAPVLEGLFWGNVSLLMLLPVALAWRYRDRAAFAGLAVGVAVAAKLFVWPLLVWLVLTKRFRAAAWASVSGAALLVVAWTTIGFQGFLGYPALLRELQQVYAERSLSVATVAGGLGASVGVAVAAAAVAGLALLAIAAWLVRRPDGDRRAFSLVVVASVVATPVVWLHYLALLYVPIAVRWPRLSAAWFFGFVVLFAERLPGIEYVSPEPCCRPADVPKFVWDVNHGIPHPWQALGVMACIGAVAVALVALAALRPRPASLAARDTAAASLVSGRETSRVVA